LEKVLVIFEVFNIICSFDRREMIYTHLVVYIVFSMKIVYMYIYNYIYVGEMMALKKMSI